MKKVLSSLLVAILTLALFVPALAAAPEASLFKVEQQTVRGNSAWTPESVPEVWMTPYFGEYIVEGKEKYPAEFVRFPIAEGSSPFEFGQDSFGAVNFDTLISYGYYVYDRASYELFLEKAEKENILADGSDGVAMYTAPDKRRGRAMIDLSSMFGETSKLTIELYDHTGDLDGEALAKLIQEETKRVQDTMKHEKLEKYWSQGAFSTVVLYDDYAKHELTLDAKDLTIIDLSDGKMMIMEKNTNGKVDKTEYELTDYLYHEEEAKEATLADGTPYKVYNNEYTGYTSFQLTEGEKPLVLSIKITCDQVEFTSKLELAYQRVMAETAK